MFYTEEDLKQAYAIGYNEAVDDVNTCIEQDSTEFGLDESYEDDDYSAVEDIVCNETKSVNKFKHNVAVNKRVKDLKRKYGTDIPNSERKYEGYAGIHKRIAYNKYSKDFNDAACIDKAIQRRQKAGQKHRVHMHI